MHASRLLNLEEIQVDRSLMRMLPVDLAYKYQALPISTDGSQITIAMAHPEDIDACRAVASAVGKPSCMVQVDPREIDNLLTQIWPQSLDSALRLSLCPLTSDVPKEVSSYAQSLTECLNADLCVVHVPWQDDVSIRTLISEIEQDCTDLILLPIPTVPRFHPLFIDLAINKLLEQTRASVLIYRKPCWPLRKILLALRDGSERGDSAIEWVLQLTKNTQASVTILPLLPTIPEMYGPSLEHNLPALLTSNDPLGKKLRWIARRLSSESVKGAFKLQNAPPLEQLRGELYGEDVDLIVITAEPKNYLWRWLFGEMVNDIFEWFDVPLLITNLVA